MRIGATHGKYRKVLVIFSTSVARSVMGCFAWLYTNILSQILKKPLKNVSRETNFRFFKFLSRKK